MTSYFCSFPDLQFFSQMVAPTEIDKIHIFPLLSPLRSSALGSAFISAMQWKENWGVNSYYITHQYLSDLIQEGMFFIFTNFKRGSVILVHETKVDSFWCIEAEQPALGSGTSAFSCLLSFRFISWVKKYRLKNDR